MSYKVEAQHDTVVAIPYELEEENSSSIIIPDMGQERPEVAKVVAVGPGRYSEFGSFISTTLQEGEIIVVPKIGTIRFHVEGEEYYLIREKEVLAKVTKVENVQ